MLDLHALAVAALAMAGLALIAWALGFALRNTGIVDSFWGMFFLLGASTYAVALPATGPRMALLLVLIAQWSLRLTAHITLRNWGEPKDRRYQAIRARNEPGYAWKSLYLVFGLQAVLALVIGMPLFAGLSSSAALNALDGIGVLLWCLGFGFEALGDWQLSRFLADPAMRGKVMDRGLWRYTRHPNYFGEALLWWGFFCIAAAAGAWWTVFAPLGMTFLLLKVSGVALLEKDIAERRPAYRDYVARTNAFFPGMPRA
mgnify:FL=1